VALRAPMCVEVGLPHVVVIRPALAVLKPGRGSLVGGLATDRGQRACGRLALVSGRGGWSAEGLAACQVQVPVNPNRSKPNDALLPTAFGRGRMLDVRHGSVGLLSGWGVPGRGGGQRTRCFRLEGACVGESIGRRTTLSAMRP
jgi:hypothetical protein